MASPGGRDGDSKVEIDAAQCNGCGVCAQVCAAKAIHFVHDRGPKQGHKTWNRSPARPPSNSRS